MREERGEGKEKKIRRRGDMSNLFPGFIPDCFPDFICDFDLKPNSPIKIVYEAQLDDDGNVVFTDEKVCLVWVRACGAYIGPGLKTYFGVPSTLNQQSTSNAMTIHGDSVIYAGWYDISKYWKHSTFHIRFIALKENFEDIDLIIKLQGAVGKESKYQIYVGADPIEVEEDIPADTPNGTKDIGIWFDRPEHAVDIIIRPITAYPLSLYCVAGKLH